MHITFSTSSNVWISQQIFFIWALTQLGMSFHGTTSDILELVLFPGTRLLTQSPTEPSVAPDANPSQVPSDPNAVNSWDLPPTHADPAWQLGQKVDIHVYMSTSPNGDVFATSNWLKEQDKDLPKFVWGNITFGDWNSVAVVQEFDVRFPSVSVADRVPSITPNNAL